jgi:hypothetical protein
MRQSNMHKKESTRQGEQRATLRYLSSYHIHELSLPERKSFGAAQFQRIAGF